jgi:hypothetical protein
VVYLGWSYHICRCPASETAVGRFESFAEGKSPICFATVDVNSNIVCKHFPFTSNILIHKRYSPFSATQRLAHKEEVRGLPTFVFYQGGEKVDEICGGNVDALESRLAAFAQ